MMLSLDTAYRSFGGEVEASSTPTICRLSDSRRHQLWAIAPLAHVAPVHSTAHRAARADFNVRAGQGRTGVILRRRPCFFDQPDWPENPTYLSIARRLVICVSQRLPAECAFQQIPWETRHER